MDSIATTRHPTTRDKILVLTLANSYSDSASDSTWDRVSEILRNHQHLLSIECTPTHCKALYAELVSHSFRDRHVILRDLKAQRLDEISQQLKTIDMVRKAPAAGAEQIGNARGLGGASGSRECVQTADARAGDERSMAGEGLSRAEDAASVGLRWAAVDGPSGAERVETEPRDGVSGNASGGAETGTPEPADERGCQGEGAEDGAMPERDTRDEESALGGRESAAAEAPGGEKGAGTGDKLESEPSSPAHSSQVSGDAVESKGKSDDITGSNSEQQSADRVEEQQSADRGEEQQSADRGEEQQSADRGEEQQSADRGEEQQSADHRVEEGEDSDKAKESNMGEEELTKSEAEPTKSEDEQTKNEAGGAEDPKDPKDPIDPMDPMDPMSEEAPAEEQESAEEPLEVKTEASEESAGKPLAAKAEAGEDSKEEWEDELGGDGGGRGTRNATPSARAPSALSAAHKPSSEQQLQLRNWKKNITMVWREISGHRLGSMFNGPIKASDAPNYYEVIRQPLDLKTIKTRIRDEVITTTTQFYRDIMHMLQNALMYNAEDTEVYQMALEIIPDARACIEQLLQTEAAVSPSSSLARCGLPLAIINPSLSASAAGDDDAHGGATVAALRGRSNEGNVADQCSQSLGVSMTSVPIAQSAAAPGNAASPVGGGPSGGYESDASQGTDSRSPANKRKRRVASDRASKQIRLM